jgi:hypothetical protein
MGHDFALAIGFVVPVSTPSYQKKGLTMRFRRVRIVVIKTFQAQAHTGNIHNETNIQHAD